MKSNGLTADTIVVFTVPDGGAVGPVELLRLSRHRALFELPNNTPTELRVSEVLPDFTVGRGTRKLYSGRAVIRGLLNTGAKTLCDTSLSEEGWLGPGVDPVATNEAHWREAFGAFLTDWQTQYQIDSDYKRIIADMQTFFSRLRSWLQQAELDLAGLPAPEREVALRRWAAQLAPAVIPSISELFDRFEEIALRLDPCRVATHQDYMRRHLHSMVLEAPFAHRTYTKPLGYAGDYEMVNMILRDAPEGESLFGKVLHAWFVRQKPAEAHRNRIDYLIQEISEAVLRASARGQVAKIFNLACGPAHEVQRFFAESPLRERAQFTLLDFNEETLNYTRACIESAAAGTGCRPHVQYVKQSVHQLMKDRARKAGARYSEGFDLVYCAGLFDYLSDGVCHALLDIMYDWAAPGGMVVATNVEPRNPRRHGMDHLLDWPLIYRTAADMTAIKPADAREVRVYSDQTGVNVFLEARKLHHG
jgi:extracellular factor (EF) 3-hydroxypalmitic acid methyl ester biosynthesis protein